MTSSKDKSRPKASADGSPAKNPPAKHSPGKHSPDNDVSGPGAADKDTKVRWDLRLYVAGETPRSRKAIDSLRQLCNDHLGDEWRLEVIDLRKNPALARGDQIVAVPTLVRKLPPPLKRIIGDLSDFERVLVGLDLRETSQRQSDE